VSTLRLILIAALVAGPAGAAPRATPPSPYVDQGACPFECCTYRDWTTRKSVTLLDKPNGKIKVGAIAAGVTVRGITGEVHSRPLRMRAAHAYEGSPINSGDTFYALHSVGEGYWAVWFKNKVYSVNFYSGADDEAANLADDFVWWVKIRTRAGKTGWVLDTGLFGNQDSCG
jgi:hypothetical protein